MKKLFFPVVISVLGTAFSLAQAPSNASASPAEQVAPGSVIPAELTKSVDAKKAKQGDPVQAKTTQELLSRDGHVAVPLGAKIEGHVTEAKPHEKGESPSTLSIVFDKMVFKDGHEVPMNAAIQALAPPQENMNLGGDSVSQPGMPGASPSQPSGGMYGGMTRPAGSSPAENPSGGMGTGGTGNPGSAPVRNGLGKLSTNAQGVIGIPGMSMQGDVLTSQKKNVKLDSGTQLMLRVVGKP